MEGYFTITNIDLFILGNLEFYKNMNFSNKIQDCDIILANINLGKSEDNLYMVVLIENPDGEPY